MAQKPNIHRYWMFAMVVMMLTILLSINYAFGQQKPTPTQIQQAQQEALKHMTPDAIKAIDWSPEKISSEQCQPVIPVCGCGQIMKDGKCSGGTNKYLCPCMDPRGVVGICQVQGCQGLSATGLDGSSMGLGGQLQGIVGQLMQGLQQMMQGGGGEGGGGAGSGTGQANLYPNCTTNPITNIVSNPPCMQGGQLVTTSGGTGTGSGSLTTGAADALRDALNQVGAPQSISELLGTSSTTAVSALGSALSQLNASVTSVTETPTGATVTVNIHGEEVVVTTTAQGIVTNVRAGTTGSVTTAPLSPQGVVQTIIQPFPQPVGVRGDIQDILGGSTIIAGSRTGSSEVSGFYGTGTLGDQTSVVGRLCTTRPWSTNFLSYIITPTFFDNLCVWRGYTVGLPVAPPPQSQGTSPQAPAAPQAPVAPGQQVNAPVVPFIPAQLNIWAVPAAVPVGARTYIYWTAQGVSDCSVWSQDGSFYHNTLSGAASTVPIAGATVFTISCTALDGTQVSDQVTVRIAI